MYDPFSQPGAGTIASAEKVKRTAFSYIDLAVDKGCLFKYLTKSSSGTSKQGWLVVEEHGSWPSWMIPEEDKLPILVEGDDDVAGDDNDDVVAAAASASRFNGLNSEAFSVSSSPKY